MLVPVTLLLQLPLPGTACPRSRSQPLHRVFRDPAACDIRTLVNLLIRQHGTPDGWEPPNRLESIAASRWILISEDLVAGSSHLHDFPRHSTRVREYL